MSLQQGEEAPALFSDPLLAQASYWVLSTSAIHSKHFLVYGWGEVVPDGFGVAYVTGYDGKNTYFTESQHQDADFILISRSFAIYYHVKDRNA